MNDNDTRTALLETATRLFSREGFRGASVRRITSEAGANLGAITYHFGSKEKLYGEVLAETIRPLRDAQRALADETGSPLARIERFVERQYLFLGEHPELRMLMLRHLASDADLPDALAEMMESLIGILVGLVGEAQRAGEVRAGDPRHLAVCVASGPIWFNMIRRPLAQVARVDQDTAVGRRAIASTIREFVRAGLEKRT